VPVVPAAEVLLAEPLFFDDVVDDHVGDIEPAQSRSPGAQVPLALRLVPQRAGLAA
jgi:hypothetical protein